MFKALAALAVFAAGATMTFATTTISGSFIFVSGTSTTTITPKAAAQTITLKVGSTNETFSGVIVTGSTAAPIMAGTPFEILEKGSQPFAASYTSTDLLANPTDLSGISGRRTIPMTTAGVLSDSIGFPVGEFDINIVSLFLPPCTLGSFEFKNGIDCIFSGEVKSYSIQVPTSTAVGTLGTAEYPLTVDPLESFSFTASGNGAITVNGSGTSSAASSYQYLYLAGLISGSPTFFTAATLNVSLPGSQ